MPGYITTPFGEFDSGNVISSIMSDVRKPVFVDNAVHYGELTSQVGAKSKVTLTQDSKQEYKLATEKSYSYSESESSILLTHKETPGHSIKSAIWSPEGINNISKLLYSTGETEKRLLRSTLESTTSGLRAELKNMKNRNLHSLGITSNSVHSAQPLDVGFRSTDLAIKLASDVDSNVTSISIGNPLNVANSGSGRRKHSNVFVAHDFNRMNLLTAMRVVSRHDNRVMFLDNFANLLYVPINHTGRAHFLDNLLREGAEEKNPVDFAENRVSVQGVPLALNEDVVVVVDDASRQQGKFDSDIIEKINPVLDVTVRDKQTARKVARQILKANSIRQGSITTEGHLNSWHLRPGDVVDYEFEKYMIVEATHNDATRLSDFLLLSLDRGLEGVFQRLSEGTTFTSNVHAPDTASQIKELDFSFFEEMEISIIPVVYLTGVSTNGVLIGQHASRVSIGGNAHKIGLNKSLTTAIRGEM